MTQIIEISGGLVTVVNREIQHTARLEDWLPLIEKRAPVFVPVLPSGTRAVYWDPTDLAVQRLSVMIEREPHIMNLDYQGTNHRVTVPYTRFVFYAWTRDPSQPLNWMLEDYRVFWSDRRYSDPARQDMVAAKLPNVYGDGRICFGSTAADSDQSLADRLDQTVNEFFVSEFNSDLGIHLPDDLAGWRAWERMTESNPTGWTEWPEWGPQYSKYSWDNITGGTGITTAGRAAPVIAPNPIPPLVLGATFGRVNEWLDTLDPAQRFRLAEALSQRDDYEDAPEPEEDPF